MNVASLSLLLIRLLPWRVGSSRPVAADDPHHNFNKGYHHVHEAAASEEIFDGIQKFFETDGPMGHLMQAINRTSHGNRSTDDGVHGASRRWTQNAAANNEAARGIARSTWHAQNALMHDALDVNDKIRNKVLTDFNFETNVNLNPKDRSWIRGELRQKLKAKMPNRFPGTSVLPNPDGEKTFDGDAKVHAPVPYPRTTIPGVQQHLVGAKVLIRPTFTGEKEHLIRGHIGILKEPLDNGKEWKVDIMDENGLEEVGEPVVPLEHLEFIGPAEYDSNDLQNPVYK